MPFSDPELWSKRLQYAGLFLAAVIVIAVAMIELGNFKNEFVRILDMVTTVAGGGLGVCILGRFLLRRK
ncbi:MAG: hypothetical protein LBR60_07125 [Fibrobacter sp.]|jgi:general stress protein CsbA|nr:hypothetical protein [Fibrobacter sp.]